MKKLMTVCAACMVAGMVSAQVESQNIVGYQTPAMVGGTYNMYSVPFSGVGTANDFSLNDLTGDLVGGASALSSDNVLIWDATGGSYATYYLYESAAYPSYNGWYNAGSDVSFDTDYPAGLPAGSSFWLKSTSGTDGDITVSGEVLATATNGVAIVGGTYNMVANPYPVAFSLNSTADCDWLTDGATGGASALSSDNVLIWDATAGSYATYYLYESAAYPSYNGWYNAGSDVSFDTDYPNGLAAGAAFWYKSTGAGFTADFKKTF